MMKQTHPFLRAMMLAFVLALASALLGTPALMERIDLAHPDKPLLVFAAMVVAGAFIAALPGRLRRWGQPWQRSGARGCGIAFMGGLLATLGLQLAEAGDLRIVAGVLQGGLGALAFAGCAWLTAAVTVILTDRVRP